MPMSDRAFRALARAEPETIFALIRAIAPGVLPARAHTFAVEPAPTQIDRLPPPLDTDWIARVGRRAIIHLEAQGYRDTSFLERIFYYHLGGVLRYRKRTVRTVALWLIVPPESQRRDTIT